MTGAGRISVARIDDIGHFLSGADFYLATAGGTSRPLPDSHCTHVPRHRSRVVTDITIGIRGATPPPAG